MSLLRPKLPRLALVAMTLILMGALVAAPSVSGAKNAVKQFTATISPTDATGGVAGSWTVTVTNCGGSGFPDPRCTLASTIGLGSIRIFVPTEFRPIGTPVPNLPNWTASYNSATGNINANVTSGSNKLQPGQSVDITFSATPTTCPSAGDRQFTAAAWGSTTISGSDPFTIQGAQPFVTLAGSESCLESGDSIMDPETGQTETITGDFTGHVLVRFGGEEGPDCSNDEIFGALGDQWQQFHLPAQVVITPGDDFHPGSGPKVSTSEFDQSIFGGDSSWYLICYASPTAFVTRGGGDSVPQSIDGTEFQVGILASCVDAPTPCVSEQFLTLTTPHQVVISVRIPPNDPYKR
jgi:hypothetical protein